MTEFFQTSLGSCGLIIPVVWVMTILRLFDNKSRIVLILSILNSLELTSISLVINSSCGKKAIYSSGIVEVSLSYNNCALYRFGVDTKIVLSVE